MIEHVLIGKHFTDPKTEWMIYRGTEEGARLAENRMRKEPNGSKIKYSTMTFEEYMENQK